MVRTRPRRHQPRLSLGRARSDTRRQGGVLAQGHIGHSCAAGRDRTLRRGGRRARGPRWRARGDGDPTDGPSDPGGQRCPSDRHRPRRPPPMPTPHFAPWHSEVAPTTCASTPTPPPDGSSGLSPVGADDAFLINSTSGTTGLPKCVVHTPESVALLPPKAVANGDLTADDVFLPVIPTPFGFGIWTSHTTPIHLGATTVRIERFDPAATCAADRASPCDGAVLRQHTVGDDPRRPRGP